MPSAYRPIDPAVLARHRRRNRLQSVVVLAAIGGLMAAAGWLVAGVEGIGWSVLATALALLFQPLRSVTFMRALWGALPLTAEVAPGLVQMVGQLSRRAELERVPPLWYIPRPEILALSTGWGRDAAVAVSDGLLRVMPPRELAAVLAHEISHLRAGDLKLLRLAEAAGSLTRFLSLFGLVMVAFYLPAALSMGAPMPLVPILLLMMAPIASDLMMLKLSRTREYAADAGAAELTGDPRGLIGALERLERLHGGGWERLYRPRWLGLMRTHPDTGERVSRLAEMAPAPEPTWIIMPEALVLPALALHRRARWGRWG